MEKSHSERLTIIRFPLIVGVIFIHAVGGEVNFQNSDLGIQNLGEGAYILQNILSNGIASISVPLFFFISGYLFFYGYNGTYNHYISKIKSRFSSLMIPFLVWNLITLVAYYCAQQIHEINILFSGKTQPVESYSVFDFFNNLFGLNKSPISYQFWFIRDLMITVLFAPLFSLMFLIPIVARLGFVTLLILWLLNLWPIYIPSIDSLLFFYAGAFISNRNMSVFLVDKLGFKTVAIYLIVLIADCATKGYIYNPPIHKIGILLGIVSVLILSQYVIESSKLKSTFIKLSSASFFVFALHEPLLTLIKKLSYKIFEPTNDVTISSIYLLIPFLVIIICLQVFKLCHRVAPKILRVLIGGR